MRHRSISLVSGATVVAVLLSISGCSNESSNCSLNSNCVPPDAGQGGTSGVGGSTGIGGNSSGGTSTTSACNPACSGTKPVCNESAKTCVQCTKDGNCSGNTPLCDTIKNACVQCKANTDCTSATASLCSNGTCSPCTQDADCSQISGKNACATGACVQCTPSNESACNGNSCNPKTNTCTSTPVNSVTKCHSCVADSECIGGNAGDGGTVTARCVQLTFNGNPHGNYCLQRVASGCASPYTVPINIKSSSGAASDDYCAINQAATTCEAVQDLIASKTCSGDVDCGSGAGGLCKTVGVLSNRCTIPCDSAAQCLASAPGNTCTPPDFAYCH